MWNFRCHLHGIIGLVHMYSLVHSQSGTEITHLTSSETSTYAQRNIDDEYCNNKYQVIHSYLI